MSDARLVTLAMLQLRVQSIWRSFLSSPMSFKLLSVYVFFEYVRPQSIYEFLAGPPWSLISILAALVAFLVEGRRPNLPTWASLALSSFAIVLVLSSIFAEDPSRSINDLKIFGNWLLVIVLVSGTVTTERRWFLFLSMFLLFSLKMSQHGFRSWIMRGFAFTGWGVTGGPGWFANSGEFALQMGIFVPLSAYLFLAIRPFLTRTKRGLLLLLPISGLASIIASSSRGGLLAIAAVAIWAALRSRHRIRAIVGLVVVAPILWLIVPSAMKARFSTAGTDATSVLRLRYWKYGVEMAKDHPILGVGVGNWESYYRSHYFVEGDSLNRFNANGELKIEVAHNSFIEVGSQMGFIGLAAFLAVLASVIQVNHRTRAVLRPLGARGRLLTLSARALDDGIIAFCIAGFFMSVAFYPFVWFQLAMAIGLHSAAQNLVHGTKRVNALNLRETRESPRRLGQAGAPERRPTLATHLPTGTADLSDDGVR